MTPKRIRSMENLDCRNSQHTIITDIIQRLDTHPIMIGPRLSSLFPLRRALASDSRNALGSERVVLLDLDIVR